jgi:hypothetical protein
LQLNFFLPLSEVLFYLVLRDAMDKKLYILFYLPERKGANAIKQTTGALVPLMTQIEAQTLPKAFPWKRCDKSLNASF